MALARARPIQSLVATLVFSKVTLPVDLRSVISTVSTFIRSRLTTWLPHLKLKALQADRKSTRLNSSHLVISYAVFCLKKKKTCPSKPFTPALVQSGTTQSHYLTTSNPHFT